MFASLSAPYKLTYDTRYDMFDAVMYQVLTVLSSLFCTKKNIIHRAWQELRSLMSIQNGHLWFSDKQALTCKVQSESCVIVSLVGVVEALLCLRLAYLSASLTGQHTPTDFAASASGCSGSPTSCSKVQQTAYAEFHATISTIPVCVLLVEISRGIAQIIPPFLLTYEWYW